MALAGQFLRLMSLTLFLGPSTTRAFLSSPSIGKDLTKLQHDDVSVSPLHPCRGMAKKKNLCMTESTVELDVILFGVGDLRFDDHEGLYRAVGGGGENENVSRKVLPLVILDDASLANIPGVVSHTVDTTKMVVAAVEDLQTSLKQKLDLDLGVIWSCSTLPESLVQIVGQYAASNIPKRVHVHDLGDADNLMGYGPYGQLLQNSSKLPANVEVIPWTCPLRAKPWRNVASLPDRYPDFVDQFASSEVPVQPISIEANATKRVTKIPLDVNSLSVPPVDALVQRIQATLRLDPTVIKAEVNTGIFQSHWGGLNASTIGESKVLQNLNIFKACNEEDERWLQHPGYVAKDCRQNERSLEHATFKWMLRGNSGGTETDNLIAGEPMTRYLSAPLLFGTLSGRRLWHMSTRERPFFVSPLKTLAEGREWHKLLASKNIQTRSEYRPVASSDARVGTTSYGYWRCHGFLCRYARTPLVTPTVASTKSYKDGVLFFHGFGASGSQWNKALNELASIVSEDLNDGNAMEGLAPDLIGFGQSEKPPISYSIYVWDSQCTDFIKEVAVARQGWDSYIVGGNSIGGFSAASTAANECAEVEGRSVSSSGAPGTGRCQGVVLMNTAGPILSREVVQKIQTDAGGGNNKPQTVAQLSATGALPPCKPVLRPVARFFGNGLLAYLRPRIQSICVNLYPVNPAAVDGDLCSTIERDSVDPGGIAVMMSGTKLPPPRSMNELLRADFGCASENSALREATFGGPVLVATGVLDPLNDAKGRSEALAALRQGIEFDPINAGHCPHDELPRDVAMSIAKWMAATVKPMKSLSKSSSSSSVTR